MPTDDVSDLKDVFDAINRLCETMKTSNYSDDDSIRYAECSESLVSPAEVDVRQAVDWNVAPSEDETIPENATLSVSGSERKEWADQASRFVSAEDLSIQRMETQRQKWKESQASLASSEVSGARDAHDRWSDPVTSPPAAHDRWSDCRASPPHESDAFAEETEPAAALCEPISDVYYTASSEISLLSDSELPERLQPERDSDREEEKECVVAGHVAAMRERFESMTRANTPCPDAGRAASPPLDVFRVITPSPDLLR